MSIRVSTIGFVAVALLWVQLLLPSCVAFQLPAFTRRVQLSWNPPPSDSITLPMSSSGTNEGCTAQEVVTTCMDALLQNDHPWDNAGLEVTFDLSSDRCRAALGGSLDDFISYASNPTFGPLANAKEYSVVSVGPVIAATMTRGAMQTVLIKVQPAKGSERTFLW